MDVRGIRGVRMIATFSSVCLSIYLATMAYPFRHSCLLDMFDPITIDLKWSPELLREYVGIKSRMRAARRLRYATGSKCLQICHWLV